MHAWETYLASIGNKRMLPRPRVRFGLTVSFASFGDPMNIRLHLLCQPWRCVVPGGGGGWASFGDHMQNILNASSVREPRRGNALKAAFHWRHPSFIAWSLSCVECLHVLRGLQIRVTTTGMESGRGACRRLQLWI